MTRATALAMKLALITGQRTGEVIGIAESELATDGAMPIWVIPRGRTKNSEPNRVPLSPIALRVIAEARELAAGSPWVFPGPTGEAMQTHSATRTLERSLKAIGVAHFRVHDLRRTAATGMAEPGRPGGPPDMNKIATTGNRTLKNDVWHDDRGPIPGSPADWSPPMIDEEVELAALSDPDARPLMPE